MRTISTSVFKVFFLGLLASILSADVSFGQCSVTAPPSYSVSCLNQYFTAITASGTGVSSSINYSGSSCAGTYFDYYSSQGATVPAGNTLSINMNRFTTTYIAYISVYVDWNNDGQYTGTELAGTMQTLSASTLSTVYSFTVPGTGIVTGTNLHMRVMMSEVPTGAPCSANYGESCDYFLNVDCPSAPVINVSPSSAAICNGGSGASLTASGAGAGGTYSWAPATGLSSTAGATVTANPTTTTTYTVTGTVGSGCISSTAPVTVTVYPMPGAITGATGVCVGSSISLSNAVTGGMWYTGSSSFATVDATTGTVYGVSSGMVTINYTTGGACIASTNITVDVTPDPITGVPAVCSGVGTLLSDDIVGGFWSSANTNIVTVSSNGIVSGVSGGTADISYTIGGCSVTVAVTVTDIQPITGGASVCAGGTLALSDATPGGVWSSALGSIATISANGLVTGLVSGSSAIYYTIGLCYQTVLVNVGSPVAPIVAAGNTTICSGTVVILNDATPGGIWSSGNVAVATCNGGAVTGASRGTATISYTVPGCSTTINIMVDTAWAGVIAGKDSVCIGLYHQITLSDVISGGTWSSTSTARATVDPATGVVTGVVTGVDTIKYTVTNACGTFVARHVLHVRTNQQCALAAGELASENEGLNVFPNPNTGSFTMNLSSANDEDMQVVITNLVGAKVQEFNASTNKRTEIQLHQPPGMYLLTAYTTHGRYVVKVVVE